MKKKTLLYLLCHAYPDLKKELLYAYILCGKVSVNSEYCKDPKFVFRLDSELKIQNPKQFVSRGGEKLEHAIDKFYHLGFEVLGRIALDAGASHGGFCDCLLQHHCSMVYAIDSGKNQLDYRLRQNPAVLSYESCKIQDFLVLLNCTSCTLTAPDIVVMDIAFRSILDLVGPCLRVCKERQGIFLCKPQFEWTSFCSEQKELDHLDFNGVLSDDYADLIFNWFCEKVEMQNIHIIGTTKSPIRGKQGNSEYFLYLQKK